MRVDKIAAGREADYVGQTQGRIVRISQTLDRLREGGSEDLDALIGQVLEQERASRESQFAGLARVTRDMVACLQGAQEVQRPLAAGTVDALLDACQCILLHAEAVEAGMFSRSHRCGTAGERCLPEPSAAESHGRSDATAGGF